jgi:protein-tyrosine phosphatase
MADGLLRKKVAAHQLDIFVDSAGTAAYHIGAKPDVRMRKTAKSFGVDLELLRAREFTVHDFDEFDIIYAMDKSNRSNILALARNESDQKKVKMILNELEPGRDNDVPDPYYGSEKDFIVVYELMDAATDKVIERIFAHGKR